MSGGGTECVKKKGVRNSTAGEVEDLLRLPECSMKVIVDEIEGRYRKDLLYTNVGDSVVVSLNPNRPISHIYGPKVMNMYKNCCDVVHLNQQPPHLFRIAEAAYRRLKTFSKNQSIIVSGESGSGKTEATKYMMRYLSGNGGNANEIEKKVLASNPLLEAFGNAVTVRNDNSSRFGKFIEVIFKDGRISFARIKNFLLERFRVIHQEKGERNFHVFYYLMAGLDILDADCRALMGLDPRGRYAAIKGRVLESDREGFVNLMKSFYECGFESQEVQCIMCQLAGIIHLSNCKIVEDAHGTPVFSEASDPYVSAFCRINGFRFEAFQEAVCSRLVTDKSRNSNPDVGEAYTIKCERYNLNSMKAQAQLNAIIMDIYNRLFQYIVFRINDSLGGSCNSSSLLERASGEAVFDGSSSAFCPSPSSAASMSPRVRNEVITWEGTRRVMYQTTRAPETKAKRIPQGSCIGILDIYGFEVFPRNGFEQFLVNYANEKLQFNFNESILRQEQDVYMSEGLPWEVVPYEDNTLTIELIEGGVGKTKVTAGDPKKSIRNAMSEAGILQKIDDLVKVSDVSTHMDLLNFLDKKDHSRLRMSNKSRADHTFFIDHYAGPVEYDVTHFVEKNRDRNMRCMVHLVCDSRTAPLLELLYFERNWVLINPEEGIADVNKPQATTFAKEFKSQLEKLLEAVNSTSAFYVRCVKPNEQKQPGLFDGVSVDRQLKAAGMLATINIRKHTYAYRLHHTSFLHKYAPIMGTRPQLEFLTSTLGPKSISWDVGKTTMFMSSEAHVTLEKCLQQTRTRAADTIRIGYWRWRVRSGARRFLTYALGIENAFCMLRSRVLSGRVIEGSLERYMRMRWRHGVQMVSRLILSLALDRALGLRSISRGVEHLKGGVVRVGWRWWREGYGGVLQDMRWRIGVLSHYGHVFSRTKASEFISAVLATRHRYNQIEQERSTEDNTSCTSMGSPAPPEPRMNPTIELPPCISRGPHIELPPRDTCTSRGYPDADHLPRDACTSRGSHQPYLRSSGCESHTTLGVEERRDVKVVEVTQLEDLIVIRQGMEILQENAASNIKNLGDQVALKEGIQELKDGMAGVIQQLASEKESLSDVMKRHLQELKERESRVAARETAVDQREKHMRMAEEARIAQEERKAQEEARIAEEERIAKERKSVEDERIAVQQKEKELERMDKERMQERVQERRESDRMEKERIAKSQERIGRDRLFKFGNFVEVNKKLLETDDEKIHEMVRGVYLKIRGIRRKYVGGRTGECDDRITSHR